MRPEHFVPLTVEEHRELGNEIRQASMRLHELERLVGSIYGPTNQAAFSFRKVVEAMDRLQEELESQAAADLPGYITDGFYR